VDYGHRYTWLGFVAVKERTNIGQSAIAIVISREVIRRVEYYGGKAKIIEQYRTNIIKNCRRVSAGEVTIHYHIVEKCTIIMMSRSISIVNESD